MKKSILALVIAAITLVPATASAFSFDWGVTGGYNLSKVSFSSDRYGKNFSSGNRSGWFIGPKINLGLAAGFHIDAAATFSQRNLNVEGESEMYNSFEIPVNVKYALGLGKNFSFQFATGPQFGFGVGKSKWRLDDYDYNNTLAEQTFRRENMQMSWNLSAGMRILKAVELTANYNFALSRFGRTLVEDMPSSVTQNTGGVNCRSNTFQVQATYYF